MRRDLATVSAQGFLGIEAGGSKTTALFETTDGTGLPLATFGPANLQLLDEAALAHHLRTIAAAFPVPVAVGIGMAGARTPADRERLHAQAAKVWPHAVCLATNDLESALAAAPPSSEGETRVLVLAGTGSCCYGRGPDGEVERAGGWGHLLGDQGSGYDLALGALRDLLLVWDRDRAWGALGAKVLAQLALNEPTELIRWAQGATKGEIAALAPVVFAAARSGDRIARAGIHRAAASLVGLADACATRLAAGRRSLRFILAGGVLVHQPAFARVVRDGLRRRHPRARFDTLDRPGAWGALNLAREAWSKTGDAMSAASRSSSGRRRTKAEFERTAPPRLPSSSRLSPTEERHPRSMALDRLPPGEAIELMLSEDARIPAALKRAKPEIERALRLVVSALRRGGRLFYVGAGTSGRLGILDASECPPTFRTPPERVQGIIAGGRRAVFESVEGAEDDFEAGASSIEGRAIERRDVVVGIAASGRTPFVWGALTEARRRGAPTVLIAFNPHLEFRRGQRPTVVIAPDLGPEVLTGSTRLKAGTATKLLLNLLTTLAMVRLGKVISNLMVDLNPANTKLRERAVRMTRQLVGVDEAAARAALEASGWVVKDALKRLGYRRT